MIFEDPIPVVQTDVLRKHDGDEYELDFERRGDDRHHLRAHPFYQVAGL
jgi:hypothetical protein